MTNLYLEELEIGTRSAGGPYIVSKDEIIQFAKQYDPVPRHIDEQAAARSVFGGLTASSAHTFSIFILLTTRLQPRLHVLAGMGWDGLRLPNAVRPGDELDLETTVLEMRESKSKSDRGIVCTRVLLRNQKARNGAGVYLQYFRCAAAGRERADLELKKLYSARPPPTLSRRALSDHPLRTFERSASTLPGVSVPGREADVATPASIPTDL